MWFPTDNMPPNIQNTPRAERRLPKIERPGGTSGWHSDISRPSKTGSTKDRNPKPAATKPPGTAHGEKPFFVEDDRKSKITVVSLKSARTSRTVQTAQSSLATRPIKEKEEPKGRMQKAKKKIQEGFRESSIKRIIAAGLCVAATLLYLFGVFLPFWSVYTTTSSGVTTGYYAGLWNRCVRVTGQGTDCDTYSESSLEDWFRTARGLELLAFMCIVAAMALVVAYMFCFREVKYGYMQWIIIGLCFAAAVFSFTGLVVYGVGESDSGRLSSAYGLTFCAFLGALATALVFLWDKLHKKKKVAQRSGFRGLSGIPSSRPGHRAVGSRMSHVRSAHGGGGSQLSGPSVARSSTRVANNTTTTTTKLAPPKEA